MILSSGLVLAVGCGADPSAVAEPLPDGGAVRADAASEDTSVPDTGLDSAQATGVCGDRNVSGSETCDDGNSNPGDGCNGACLLEPGWTCPSLVLRCSAAACGDGIVAGSEECDFASPTAGCSDCKVERGYDCDATGCVATVCGDQVVERGEQCDDGNDIPFDGCYTCILDPRCTNGVCEAACGDGQRFEREECDDANTRDGDGCSATCTTEVGFVCEDRQSTPPPTLTLPVIYRDFIGQGNSARSGCYDPVTSSASPAQPEPCYHIDFNGLVGGGVAGIVDTRIGADGRPVYSCPQGNCDRNPGHLFIGGGNNRPNTNGPLPFAEWYDSASPNNIALVDQLTLSRQMNGTYVFDATNQFYPLDGKGFVAAGEETVASSGCPHNVSFTSETHFWFQYQGGEEFNFDGDDDVWVFVNGVLVIDLGGLHGSLSASFALDGDDDIEGPDVPDGTAQVTNALRPFTDLDLGLSPGGVYEVVMFHAERNECGSNFKVTLKDFNRPLSVCRSTCGDGVMQGEASESCDDGNTRNGDGCDSMCLIETLR